MILVTGADGMVGSYVSQVFNNQELILTDIDTLDISQYEQVEEAINKHCPQAVLHLAARTDVDACETEIEATFQTNALGTKNIALACKKYDVLLVYISTGAVFDGRKPTPYTEADTPNPLSQYAKSKYEGEKHVQAILHKYFIARAGWMIGGGDKDKKFVAKIVSLCQSRPEIKVVNDKFGTITYAKHLLQNIKALMATKHYGLYHMANAGVCTRFEIAREIAKYLNSPVKIIPVGSDTFPLPAPRGRSEAMINQRLNDLSLDMMPSWQEALREYLTNWLKEGVG